jgi:hypothetical protein
MHHPCSGIRYVVVFLAISLTACATSSSRNPYKQYKAVQESATQVAFNDAQAITNAVAVNLHPEQPIKAEITPADPKIQHDSIQSNYKIFKFQGIKHSLYTIEIRSLCDCWGLDKFILYPVARVLDKHGNILNENPVNISLSNPDWNYPVNIRMVWEGEFDESGFYYLLVSAYNDNIGTTCLTYTEFDYLSNQIQKVPLASSYLELLNSVGNPSREIRDPSKHSLWSSPAGKIVVTLTMQAK